MKFKIKLSTKTYDLAVFFLDKLKMINLKKLRNPRYFVYETNNLLRIARCSVGDPWHFGADPIRTSD